MLDIETLGLIVLVCGSFAATNIDNLVLLVVLMGAEPQRRAGVALGFVTSATCLLAIATLGAVVGASLDPGYLGYLGVIPLLMGLYFLARQFLRPVAVPTPAQSTPAAGTGWLAAFGLMLSNSGDSLAVFFPLLAESDRDSLLWEVSLFLGMTLLWVTLAWHLAGNPALSRRIEAVGERLVPWIMMAAGIYILMDTGTDTLL